MYFAIFVLLLLAPAASLEIVCGLDHNCVFERGQKAMKCWGRNDYGQLGLGDTNNRGDEANEMGSNLPFVRIGSDFIVEAMDLGGWHSCAMSDDRAMKCFGSNAESQLGFDGPATTVTTTGDALPFLEFAVDFNLSKIAAGELHTCVLSTDAKLKCFGDNRNGQCGAGTTTSPFSGPPSQITAIDFGTDFTTIDVRTFGWYACVLSQQRTLKCFGRNLGGVLGYGDLVDRGNTTESMGDGLPIVDLGSNFTVEAMVTSTYHSCALSTTKTVKCWGCGGIRDNGQCGTPHSLETGDNLPVLEFGADFVPMQLALGSFHTCILSQTAAVICFGDNWQGQLGIGSTTDVFTPSTLTGIDLGTDFVPRQVAAGYHHTCAVSTSDAIKCWGGNDNGQLGLGHNHTMGDEPDEMGDNLPIVDVAWPAPATTAPPTTATASPTSKQPTARATSASPTSVTPTTAMPSRSPTVSPSTTEPTTPAPTTMEPTSETPTASPETVSPTAEPTMEPSTRSPSTESTTATTFEPTTQSPTLTTLSTTVSRNTTVIVTIRTDSLSSTEILIAIANAYNLSSSLLTVTELSSNDDDDGFATVTLLVAVASNTQLEFDVIEATLREAMVEEYGDDIEVDITEGDAPTQEQPEHPLQWLVPVAYCIVSVCCCFSVFGIVKCTLARRRQHGNDEHDQLQAAQIELPERRQPLPAAVVMPNAYGHNLHSESEVEEKKEDMNPGGAGHGEPDMVMEDSVSNRDEAQPTTRMNGMAEDELINLRFWMMMKMR